MRAGLLIAVLTAAIALIVPARALAEATVQVTINGTGSGTVRDSTNTIQCPGVCSKTSGVTLVAALTATPDPGSVFAGWDYDLYPQVNPPNPAYSPPATKVLAGCGLATDCTIEVGSAPDSLQPGCGPPITSNCFNPHFAVTNVRATFVKAGDSLPGAPAANEPEPRPENNVFLCYSKWQVDPGVWPLSAARTLFDSGYWQPFALQGSYSKTRPGGGEFTLACNLPAGMAAPGSGSAIDSGGVIYPNPPYVSGLGFYPIAREPVAGRAAIRTPQR